jgi:hypothetical protein
MKLFGIRRILYHVVIYCAANVVVTVIANMSNATWMMFFAVLARLAIPGYIR